MPAQGVAIVCSNQQLGYPLYIIPLIGVTHILGGLGLLIPNVPQLTQWVYAGLAIDLLLAFSSQLSSGSTGDEFDPILVMAFVFASYVLRRCMRANRWLQRCCSATTWRELWRGRRDNRLAANPWVRKDAIHRVC